MDLKMKKMAELQLSIMSDPRSRHTVASQIAQWEQNLEQLHCHLYRYKHHSLQLNDPYKQLLHLRLGQGVNLSVKKSVVRGHHGLSLKGDE